MNRRIVGYSTLASIAVAAAAGGTYLCWLRGIHADETNGDAGKSTRSATASDVRDRSAAPDPLFSGPVQVWSDAQQTNANLQLTGRNAGVYQAAYGDAEPRRLSADPAARPLQGTAQAGIGEYALPGAQLTGASENGANDSVDRAGGRQADPLGLHNADPTAAPDAMAQPNPLVGRDPFGSKSAKTATGTSNPPAATSIYDETPSTGGQLPAYGANSSALESTSPHATSPYAASAASDANSAHASDPASIFDTRPERAGPLPTTAAPNAYTNREAVSDVGDESAATGSTNGVRRSNTPTDAGGHAYVGGSLDSSAAQSRPSAGGPPRKTPDPRRRTASGTSTSAAPGSLVGQAGSGRPGSRQFDGKQIPQITIEKVAPPEIQVGKPAKFELHVRNTGTVPAQNLEIRDVVPEGTQFVSADPPTSAGLQGELVWTVGTLKAGDEKTIEVELMPIAEGEVGSVATVSFQAEAGARSRVTRPDLTLQVTTEREVMIGKEVKLAIRVANPGTGPATGVVLQEHIPTGLKHTAGPELEFEVGTLKPGETRDLELVVTAAQAGRIVNQISARGEGSLKAQAQCELEVIAPALAIAMDGPTRRYLERQATYTVSVSNPGTAPAKDVELVTRLPRGLKFVKANNSGHYDPNTNSVTWSLAELPPAETGTVMLTAIPTEPGEQRLRAEGRARQNLSDEKEQITVVEGVAAVLFEVMDVADPVEVKGETRYEIRVTNQGSKAADNVRLAALLPPQLKFVSAEGPTRYATEDAAAGQVIRFEPMPRLVPKADVSYRIVAQGVRPGDVRIKVQLITDDMREPVTKEESTRVYADE